MGKPSRNGSPFKAVCTLLLVLGIGAMFLTDPSWFDTLIFPNLSLDAREDVKRVCQEWVIHQQEEAGIEHTKEQELNGSDGVWRKLFNVLGYLAYCWENDPDWYPGSVLNKIIPIFRVVSLYTMIILLVAYIYL